MAMPRLTKGYACKLFGYTRQAYYDNVSRERRVNGSHYLLLYEVFKIKEEHKKMGAEKIHSLLKPFMAEHNIKLGRNGFYDLLRDFDMLVKTRRKSPRTTNSRHRFHKYRNITIGLEINKPKMLWVSDITYIRTKLGFVYLSLITDAYSHKIIGWGLCSTLSTEGPLSAARMACEAESIVPSTSNVIHHSDRGIQYCCREYELYLKGMGVRLSMTENGDPSENPIAERVNGILKYEYELDKTFDDYNDALEAIKVSIEKYNSKRPHRSINMLTPNEAHLRTGELKKKWKNNRKKHIEPDLKITES